MQSILYYETGNAFCKQKDCRLFNAHWQKDLIFSQLENRKLCKLHSDILTKLKKTNWCCELKNRSIGKDIHLNYWKIVDET